MDTQKKILDNLKNLNLEKKLFKDKEKYIVYGNNVTFIIITSEIENKELFSNYNSSSVILGETEQNLKQLYSLYDELPIPILKKEIIKNHSDELELIYELYNPMNLEQKIDLNLS
jgi:hypothetical protein